jgi:ribosome biogenesis GTPase / thiamine phosphate phosphatase
MDLIALGFDDWFGEHASDTLQPGHHLARVMTVDRGAFLVRNENGESMAELAGKFRYAAESSAHLPCVGDWVCLEQTSPNLAILHAVLPRKTILRRKCPGKAVDFQMIAANLDVTFIVQACHYDFSIARLHRYLVVANEGRIASHILLSKTDLITPEELEEMVEQIRDSGITTPILPLSNTTGTGLEELHNLLIPGKTYCLLGSSGVGKTTLINRLIGRDAFETRAVSRTGEGVHTTARRQLLFLDNGAMLVDTPGMRELGLLGASDGVDDSFSDIHGLSLTCRFSNCTHTQEPGCAVLAAIDDGDLGEERYESYLKLKKETEYHDLSYVEKRKKDRAFGRFIKSHKKRGKY